MNQEFMEQEISFVEEAIEAYKEGLGWLQSELPEVGQPFLQYTAACFAPGELSEKQKHLMALAMAIYTQDEYCLLYHGNRALQLGASNREVMETIGVCAAFGGGAGLAQGITLVRDMLEEYELRLPNRRN